MRGQFAPESRGLFGRNIQSAADIGLSKKLCEAGKVLEITVFDHIIVTVEEFYSFAGEIPRNITDYTNRMFEHY